MSFFTAATITSNIQKTNLSLFKNISSNMCYVASCMFYDHLKVTFILCGIKQYKCNSVLSETDYCESENIAQLKN